MGNLIGHQQGDTIMLYNDYEGLLLNAIEEPASKGRVENTLLHVFGYFKKDLSGDEKEFFLNLLTEYKEDRLPYLGLITVLKSWVIKYKQTYLEDQILFEPYPNDIMKMMDSGKGRV
jgi:uncharacterized protein YbgA (DUF1722 family)